MIARSHPPCRPGRSPRRLVIRTLLAGLGLPLMLASGAAPRLWAQDNAAPHGQLISQAIELEAPAEACVAYDAQHGGRRWTVETEAPAAFLAGLHELGLSRARLDELAAPDHWTATAPGIFGVTPPPEFLRRLTGRERAALYFVLAHWTDNSAERWPLVIPDEAAFASLPAAGVPPLLVERVRRLSYRFAGGFAFSDYSLLAGEFPDRTVRLAFLQAVSRVSGNLPRLRLRNALRISDVLDYWTVHQSNPYARPLLEALLAADLDEGVDLLSVLPGPPRVVAHEIDPDEVPAAISLNTYLISASLALPPHPVGDLESVFRWLNASFAPADPPHRFGDLLLLHYPDIPVVAYACAYVAEDLVFARDPVALGLWRFMRTDEILQRNPHFRDARFITYRAVTRPPPRP